MPRRLLVLVIVLTALLASRAGATHVTSYAQPASGGRALVLEPFQDQLLLPLDAGQIEANALQSAGYQVTILRNSQVTVGVLETMNQYNVVYMHTHSGPFQGGDGVVATGQRADQGPSVADLVSDGSVDPVTVSTLNGVQTPEHYDAITSTFVQKHLGAFPAHALIFINGCGMLKAPAFLKALTDKGAGVVVSWDNEATNFDNYLAGAATFNLMAQGATVAAAIQREQAAGYGVSSPTNQSKASLGYVGDGSITLQIANTPIPPTPAPTATQAPAAAPTALPTSIPTATTVPGPSISIEVKQRVVPGQRQVIRITSSPDTVLHVQVSFPNGDTKTVTTATDPQGLAVYRFRQGRSQVTYGHVFAIVSVEAIKGDAHAKQTAQYRIGWSPVDVSVLPREQVVGKSVEIWIHTRARQQVKVRLRFPKAGEFKRLLGKTGGLGWAHISYRVGQYLKNGSDHTVYVRARIPIDNKNMVGYSTFKIL